MNRRDFLKVGAGAAFLLGARRLFPASTGPGTADRADVGIVTGADYEKAVTAAVELVGGMASFVKRGDIVVVKPNIGWNSPPEVKATTDPTVVRTLVHLCFMAGASKVYVFDRGVSNTRLSYVTSGIQKAAESAGAKVFQVDDPSDGKTYKRISIPGAYSLAETLVNRYVLESDALVNVPIAKHHGEAGLTLGMKNLMGITGDERGKWHWRLDDSIADINRAVRSHLTLIDASSIMLRGGPTGGDPANLTRLDTFIAASNVVNADVEGARLFGKAASSVAYIGRAAAAGIGRMSGYSVRTAAI